MIFLSILIFILAMSLPFFKTQITPIFFTRIAALAFIYAGVLAFNTLHIHSIGSGIGIFCGFFQVTYFSLFIETFLYIVGAIILFSWAVLKSYNRVPQFSTWVSETPLEASPSSSSFSGPLLAQSGLDHRPVRGEGSETRSSLNHTAVPRSPGMGCAWGREGALKAGKGTDVMGIFETRGVASESKEFSLIALFSTLGGSLLLSSGDLLSMYLSIELQSFGLYILATIYRDSDSATGAGLKYFLLGGLSSCLILLGASLVYSFTGLTNLESIYNLVSVISMNNLSNLDLLTDFEPQLLQGSESQHAIREAGIMAMGESGNVIQGLSLGLILIIVGFLFKIAAAPFHNWSPDVYDDSPTNVTIWLTIMPKIAIVIFLLELEMGIVSITTTHFSDTGGPLYGQFIELSSLSHLLPNGATISNSIPYPHLSAFANQPEALTPCLDKITSPIQVSHLLPYGQESVGRAGEGGVYVLKNIFLLSSLLSLILGTVVGLAQIRIKRLLAYSTISHVGFLLLALAINTEQSTESLILYLIQYTITSLNTFFILLAFGYIINRVPLHALKGLREWGGGQPNLSALSPRQPLTNLAGDSQSAGGDGWTRSGVSDRGRGNSDISFILDLKGQFVSNPILSLSLAICLFSMAGIPPLMGFFGKLSVLYAAVSNGYFFMAFVAIIVSVISAYYYLRIIRELHADLPALSFRPIWDARHGQVRLGEGETASGPTSTNAKNAPDGVLFGDALAPSPFPHIPSPTPSPLGGMAQLNHMPVGVTGPDRINKMSGQFSLSALGLESGINRKGVIAPGKEDQFQFNLILTNIHSFIIATLTMSILLFVLKPSIVLNSTVLLSLSLFNG